MSPDWIVNKKATSKPKNEKDDKSFHWSITSGLNYNKITKTYLRKIEKLKRVDIDLSQSKETRKNLTKQYFKS